MSPSALRAIGMMLASATLAGLLAGVAVGQPVVYDLAGNWSETVNPNGPWAYNAAPGVPLANHLDNIFPGQPAWAYSPSNNPVFFRAVSAFGSPDDLPAGRVVLHDNDGNSSGGLGNSPAGFSWTAPADGAIQLSGGMWEVSSYLGRMQDWNLSFNGMSLSTGVLTASPSVTSATPMDLASGSGGAAALLRSVAAGDVVSLYFSRHPGESLGTFIGVDLAVQFTPVPEPGALVLAAIGGVGLLVRIRRRIWPR